MPLTASAGFISSLFSTEEARAANSAPVVTEDSSIDNSQTMALLQANVSSMPILKDPEGKSTSSGAGKKSDQISKVDPNANISIASENALIPAASPAAATGGPEIVDSYSDDISVYVVRKGDAISQIAEMFGVSVNTILWANDMKKTDKLAEGDVLIILPFSGIEHTVVKGQTLKGLAKLYKVEVEDITLANGITADSQLALGDKLMIPDAVKAEENDKPVKNLNASIAKDKKYYELHPIKNLAGYYVNPVPGARKSQGIHDKNAVDLAIAKGTPIHAAAAGKVILARNGYNGGYGNLVIISHPNGTETLYAHQSKLSTSTGAQVSQGEVIGYIGSTGRSTGPHLHFEVRGARNPGADGSWAN